MILNLAPLGGEQEFFLEGKVVSDLVSDQGAGVEPYQTARCKIGMRVVAVVHSAFESETESAQA